MADTIFSDWLSALKNLQSSVSKDLVEIRKQKAEIQQLKADILNEAARGKYIRDDERIVLSAPEIVIGNLDASGMLYGEGGSIIIRGQKLNLDGVGSQGSVETRASLISQTAIDPGPDGIEEVVRSQSAIINHAKHITLESHEAENDGFFSRNPITTGTSGVRIHADEDVQIDASQSSENRLAAIESKLDEVKSKASDYNNETLSAMLNISTVVGKMELLLKGQDLLNGNEMLMRTTVMEIDDLTQQFNALLPAAYNALEGTIKTMTLLAEAKRQQKALEDEKNKVKSAAGNFKKDTTGAHLSVTAEQMDIASKDGDNNIRDNAEAAIHIQTGRLNITTFKEDGSLIDGSHVSIATHDVELSTINPKLKENGKGDGDYITEGSVQIKSKDVLVSAVDYSIDNGKYKEKEQTKDSHFVVRAENMSMQSFDTDGNAVGTWFAGASNMGMVSADKDGNASGVLNVAAENMSVTAKDKNAKASGRLTINAKDVFVKSMDTDKSSGNDKGLADGGNMVILAEKMFVGRTDNNTLTKELQISADKTGIYGKTTAEIQQDGGKALVQLDGDNIALKGSKLEYYGDNTVNGKTEFKADVKAPKLEADNIEAKNSFKSTNISDGIAIPGAPSTAQLNAKLKENDAPKES